MTAVVYKPKWPIDVIDLCKPHYEISRTTSERNYTFGWEFSQWSRKCGEFSLFVLAKRCSNFRAKFCRKFAGTKNEIRTFRSHNFCTLLYVAKLLLVKWRMIQSWRQSVIQYQLICMIMLLLCLQKGDSPIMHCNPLMHVLTLVCLNNRSLNFRWLLPKRQCCGPVV